MIAQILDGTFQNSILRLILAFAVITALYYVTPKKGRLYFLFGANILFYLLCDWRMFVILAAETVWTFLCGRFITREKNRKGWFIAGIVPIALALFGFKYFNFFAESINSVLRAFGIGASEMTLNLLIPLGISYYTF
ncbi:MAG TPA: MBOAT family protein, partial [Clostridiales bacterium]|nr:MBOAT family protein [Clostridiales bacterium]